MARIVITLEDCESGHICCRVEMDPPMPVGGGDSQAQTAGMALVEALCDVASGGATLLSIDRQTDTGRN